MNELLVMLKVDGRRVAIPAVEVKSVIELEEIYPVPRAPDFVVGLTAMRSQSLTVIDSRLAIGIASESKTCERAAVIEVGGHLYALLVDDIEDIDEAQSELTPVAGGFGTAWERIAKGMVETGQGPALMIDIEQLVEGPVAKAA
jgi:chemotaxis signal transduction protein